MPSLKGKRVLVVAGSRGLGGSPLSIHRLTPPCCTTSMIRLCVSADAQALRSSSRQPRRAQSSLSTTPRQRTARRSCASPSLAPGMSLSRATRLRTRGATRSSSRLRRRLEGLMPSSRTRGRRNSRRGTTSVSGRAGRAREACVARRGVDGGEGELPLAENLARAVVHQRGTPAAAARLAC